MQQEEDVLKTIRYALVRTYAYLAVQTLYGVIGVSAFLITRTARLLPPDCPVRGYTVGRTTRGAERMRKVPASHAATLWACYRLDRPRYEELVALTATE